MKKFIQGCINRQISYAQAESEYYRGTWSQRHWEGFCRVWEWTTARYGGIQGFRHDAFWNKYGKEAYYRKINKTRKTFGLKEYSV